MMSPAIYELLRTDDSVVPLILRGMLATVMFPHGAQKAVGWFGGQGLKGTVATFRSFGMPTGMTILVIVAEFFGPIALITGFLARIAAGGIAVIMLGAIAFVHRPNGFFMNWFGDKAGEGYEYHVLVLAIAFGILVAGGGAWSVDGALTK